MVWGRRLTDRLSAVGATRGLSSLWRRRASAAAVHAVARCSLATLHACHGVAYLCGRWRLGKNAAEPQGVTGRGREDAISALMLFDGVKVLLDNKDFKRFLLVGEISRRPLNRLMLH